MRVIILTQNEPFYLAENINYLIENLPKDTIVASTILFDVSPFGKKDFFWNKAKKTYSIFGLSFFAHYGLSFIISKFQKKKSLPYVLRKHQIPEVRLKQSVNSKESLKIIKSFDPDLLISIAGNQIFRKNLIELAPKGCINLHTALLPKYRGLMPTFWVLKNNEKKTGVSVFFVDEGIDSGSIIIQKEFKIGNQTQKELIKETKKLGMEAIIESLIAIKSNSVSLLPNTDSDMTYYSFPTKEDVREFKNANKKFY